MWIVQTGKGKGKYVTSYSLEVEATAYFYYHSINTHSGFKKRLLDPTGKVVARYIT